ncbi:chlamydia polymorphic membrane middle domain protein, partial [Chlamydia ibidis]
MKNISLWILAASGIALSSFSGFSQGSTSPIDLFEGYNGNFEEGPFQGYTGSSYNCVDNICFCNITTASPPSDSPASSCFCSSSTLTLLGNSNNLYFSDLTINGTAGAISVGTRASNTGDLTVSGFSNFACYQCADSSGNGAICIGGNAAFDQTKKLWFQGNNSSDNGGAINCSGLSIQNCSESLVFSGNLSYKKTSSSFSSGGAIFCALISPPAQPPLEMELAEDLPLERSPKDGSPILNIQNNSEVIFKDNTCTKRGGALYSHGESVIANNGKVAFLNNTTKRSVFASPGDSYEPTDLSGGAIYSSHNSDTLTFQNNSELIFSNNSCSGTKATSSGGAICAKTLHIISGGPTLFSNNYSLGKTSVGGAISVTSSGKCHLSAEGGDIVFEGNKTITVTDTPAPATTTTLRNSIDLAGSSEIGTLNACEGYGIYFYDPITSTSVGSTGETELIINNSLNQLCTGAIVFSGEKLTDNEKLEPKNFTSNFYQPLTLKSGSLVIKDGAIVNTAGFKQEAGSKVIMDLGTTLEVTGSKKSTSPTATVGGVVLTDLYVDISSLLGGGGG